MVCHGHLAKGWRWKGTLRGPPPKTRNRLASNSRPLAILTGMGRKTISRAITGEPIQASRPLCKAHGGAGWGGGALDPTSGVIYIKATNSPALYKIIKPSRSDSLDADYAMDFSAQGLRVTFPASDSTQRIPSLPINRPPYGTLVAIDLNTGDTKWDVTLGDTPAIHNHPLLKGLNLPPVGVAGSPGPIVTAASFTFDLVFETGDRLPAIETARDDAKGRILCFSRWVADFGVPLDWQLNPVTGRRDEMVTDASFGLGEAVVSGQVEPDHYVINPHAWTITERKLGAKLTVKVTL